MTRKSLKELTDIVVPWIQVIALLAAGTFALVEYQGKQSGSNRRSPMTVGRLQGSSDRACCRVVLHGAARIPAC